MPSTSSSLQTLQRRVIACRKCPRLVNYLGGINKEHSDWWCRPVPSWGDPHAKTLVVGLAPAAGGANRTGRMFTGDLTGGSGHWVYGILHELGMANQSTSTSREDGLRLKGVYISAVARCAPPANKPTPREIAACTPYLQEELRLLSRLKVIVALGQTAHVAMLNLYGKPLSAHPFKHGAKHALTPVLTLVDSYHPSRQNTFTKKLTWPMWTSMWQRAARLAAGER